MPRNRIIIVLGILVALMPLFGFPRIWESFFQVALGLCIVVISVWSSIDKRLTLKAKAQRRALHKQREAEIVNPTEEPQSIVEEPTSEVEEDPFQGNNL